MKTKKAYIVPHTHWDREWRYPIWKNRQLLVEFMDELLETLQKDERYQYFHLDGQAIIIEDYLEIRPEKKEVIKKFVEQGKLGIGPFYTLPDLYPIAGECIVRNMQKGIQVCARYGGHIKVGYHSFGWGQISQFPQIYKNLGFEFLIAAKHVSKDRSPKIEFLWKGPDGSSIITSRLGQHSRANFYFNSYIQLKHDVAYEGEEFRYIPGKNKGAMHNTDPDKQNNDYFCYAQPSDGFHEKHIEETVTKAWKAYEDTHVQEKRLILDGSDFSSCQPDLPNIIEKANEKVEDIDFRHTSLEEYVNDVIQDLKNKDLPVVQGELRDGSPANCTGNALTTRMYLKILNRKAQNIIIGKAEPLCALMSMYGMEYPKGFMDKAWEFMFKSHAHDSINGVTQDKTVNDVQYHLNQAIEIGETMVEKGIGFLADNINTSSMGKDAQLLLLFNSLPYARNEVMKVVLDTPRDKNVWDFDLQDDKGNPLAVQHISRKERTSPVYEMDCRSWPYYHDRHEVVIETGEIPAYGYKVVKLVPKETFNRQAEWWPILKPVHGDEISQAPGILENEFLKVTLNGSTGTLNVLNKKTGKEFKGLHYFVDEGDAGDYWVNYPHYHNQLIDSRTASHRSWISDNGSLSATLVIETKMEVPAYGHRPNKGIEGESKRSEQLVTLTLVSEFTLKKGNAALNVKTTVHNTASDHRLRVYFPTGIDASHAFVDGHFTVEKRPVEPIKDKNNTFYPGMQTLPMGKFVDVNDEKEGFGIVTNSIGEYEMLRDADHTLALTLFRSVENRICTEFRASGYFPEQKGGQSLRTLTYEYALMPHAGNWEESRIMKQAERLNVSPIGYQLNPSDSGKMTTTDNLFDISPSNIVVSTLKRSEDGKGLMIRLYNPTENDETITLNVKVTVKNAYICNLIEEVKEEIKIQNHSLNLVVRKSEIKTVLLSEK